MLIFKRPVRSHRFALLVLLVVCALLSQTLTTPVLAQAAQEQEQAAGAAQAGAAQAGAAQAAGAAQEQSSPAAESPSIETIKPVSTDAQAPLAFLYIPNLTWDRITEPDAPPTSSLLAASAVGNLSAPGEGGISTLLEMPEVGFYRLAHTGSLSACAEEISAFIERDLPTGCLLVIVTAPVFDGGEASTALTPVIICGGGFNGYLTSDSTHRTGLVAAKDFTSMRSHLNEPQDSPLHSRATIKSIATSNSNSARIAHLQNDRTSIDSMLAIKAPANFAFLALVFITFSLSILLLVLGRRERTGSRAVLIPTVRLLWLIVLAFPPATFLMFTLLPAQPSTNTLIMAAVIWTALISLAALLVGWRTKWVNALIVLYGLAILIITTGQVFDGPLNMPGFLTYDITEGSRYYGMGNEQGAILFGSWITLSGLLINRYPTARGIPAFKRWGYPLGSFVLLFIATSPWFGASFGPLIWGFAGCFFSWWLFNEWRLRWWLVTLVVAIAFGLAFGILYADIALNPASHMYQVIPSMEEGFLALVTRIATDVWSYSFSLIHEYVPAVVIVFLFFVFILLVVLRVLQPGTYREFWQRNPAFRAVYSVCFILAAVTFVLEDSGVFTPAVLLIYPIACFVWLICDLHSWHLRILEESDAETPVTLRELQQHALGLLTHGDREETRRNAAAATRVPRHARGPVEAHPLPTTVDAHTRPRHAREPVEVLKGAPTSEGSVNPQHTRGPVEAQPSVGRSTATMSAATMLSRATGFIRTWAMGAALGNTLLTSAYTVANNLPNTLYELIAGGVLTTAFLPIYLAQLEKRDREGATSYASNLLSISAIVLGVIALLATIFAPQVVFTQSFLNSDFDAEHAVFFFRFFAIQVIFYGVGAIIGSLLNAHRSFLWPALGPVFNNIVVIITLFAYRLIAPINPTASLVWLAVGTTLGVVAMFVVQIPALLKLRLSLRFHVDLHDPALKDTLRMALPAAIFIIMSVIAVSVMNSVALSATPTGAATIQFAWPWYQLPYGVIGVALSTALLTEMSEASAVEDWETFRDNVRLGLRSTVFLIIPLAAIIFTMSNQLAGLYNVGAFTYDDVVNVAQLVAMWCVALPFYATYMFIYRIFSSMRDLKRFIIIDALGRVLLIVLYGFFTLGFGVWEGLGLVGIPLADACVYTLLSAAMLFVLRKRIGSFGLARIVFDGMRILVAAVVANIVPFIISFGRYDQNVPVSLVTIALCGVFALVVFYALCRLLRVPETEMIHSIVTRLKGRVRKRKR
jgi:putative peptidoglycan lipid II flippase